MFSRFVQSFSRVGLILGLIFFCASLTPSLLPRMQIVQGILSGSVFAVGYGLGKCLVIGWYFLQLGELKGRIAYWTAQGLLLVLFIAALLTLARMNVWQNSIRELMEMPPVETTYPLTVAAIAIMIALLLIMIIRGIMMLCMLFVRRANQWLPRRIAVAVGGTTAILLVIFVTNGLIIKTSLNIMDEMFAAIDQTFEMGDESIAPKGQSASLIQWDDIGKNGKKFLTDGPDMAAISKWSGMPAIEPVRVYAGYNTGETLQQRAELAVAELIRTGGFDRKILVIAVPTGTGWLDPAGIQPLAYLHHGDVSIVSMQYSYLPSWLTIIIDPDRSRRAAKALFDAIYDHWTILSVDKRPRLYLFGLSLGALGSEASADLITLLSDPIQGALWSGPPFASTIWRSITEGRNAGSPEWRPQFRDSSVIRFMTREGFAQTRTAPWGPFRLVYLQHASDPMSFFSPQLAFRRPEWLGKNRGPDVSPYFDWYPIVTVLQVAFDIPMATSVPAGFGHTFTPASYIKGWIAVTQPETWTLSDTIRLNALFSDFEASPI